MRRFVIAPDAALHMAAGRLLPRAGLALVAPARLRSDALDALYREVRAGALDQREARARLDHLRALKVRLLGDRVLQRVAWEIAAELDEAGTGPSEYLSATRLQADAFVTLDADAAARAKRVVPVAALTDLLGD